MGQKTHPYGFRLLYNKTWHSRWYGEANYAKTLHEDLRLRKQLKTRLGHAGVSDIDIERRPTSCVTISPPGRIIIGRRARRSTSCATTCRRGWGARYTSTSRRPAPGLDA